jgi:hypothetical protein
MRRMSPAAVTRGLVALICLLLGVSSCTLNRQAQATARVTFTEPTVNSALVAVVAGPAAGPSLARLVAATARPGEDVDVLGAGATASVLAAATSPSPAKVTVSSRPAAPARPSPSGPMRPWPPGPAPWISPGR